jgi:hypothetical protein
VEVGQKEEITMKKRTSFLSVLLMLLLGAVAFLSPSCDGCECPLTSERVINTSDGSFVTIPSGTDITPCNCMAASYVPLADLPDQACLPCNPEEAAEGGCLYTQATKIAAIDVTPNGCKFTPAAELSYSLPTQPWPGPTTLYILRHIPSASCPSSWVVSSTDPASVRPSKDFADGPFDHTSIFLLVDLQGDFNAMGRLSEAIDLVDDVTLAVNLDVVGSSTHPELAGQSVTFLLRGVQYATGIEELISLLAEYYEPGTTLLLHHETDGNMVIWSDAYVVQLSVEEVAW